MTNPFHIVQEFEAAIAEYAGSKYAVAVDSCSNGLLLCCLYCDVRNKIVTLPKRTYPSVPAAVIHAGGYCGWQDYDWKGIYPLTPFPIIDGAKRFRRNMYERGTLHCLSFHAKKILPIGRGGMILTDSRDAVDWLKLMRFDGRLECPLHQQSVFTLAGYNFYMTPEQAARGLLLLTMAKDHNEDQDEIPPYPDLSTHPAFRR